MISDAEIAQLLVNLYNGPTGFDFFEPGQGDSGVCWAWKSTPDAELVLLRGSATLEDWLRDFVALAIPWEHRLFGEVHPGFMMGMERALFEICGRVPGRPMILAGHSLGAGRAAILTALMIEAGIVPLARVVFGEPKPGFQQLAKYIAGVPARSYRNGTGFHHDVITDVPLTFPTQSYVHPCPLTYVSEPPSSAAATDFDAFAFHHMPLYAAALAKLEAPKQ